MSNGVFKPDSNDPDYCNAQCADLVQELAKLQKFPNSFVVSYARHLAANVPSSGPDRLRPQWTTQLPAAWLQQESVKDSEPPFREAVQTFAKASF